jgi:hypothetical protein
MWSTSSASTPTTPASRSRPAAGGPSTRGRSACATSFASRAPTTSRCRSRNGASARSGNQLAGGDNGEYVDGIGRVVRDNPTSYQAYFYARQWRDELRNGPASRAAYRRSFGEH